MTMIFRRFKPGGFITRLIPVPIPDPTAPFPGERVVPLKNLGAIRQIDQQRRAGEIDEDEHARRFLELTLPWG